MSLTLLVWLILFAAFSVMALVRPVWGWAVYVLTFFACPALWWWGKGTIGEYRWALYGGIIFLIAGLAGLGGQKQRTESPLARWTKWSAVAILANATFVHFALSSNWEISSGPYIDLAKYVLLFGMLVASIRNERDLRFVLLSIVIGAAYIGYEVTINDRGSIQNGRLEGIGVPSASDANGMACLVVTILPLTGVFFIAGKWWERLIALPAAPFIVNVLLLCNSRGAFLAAIGSGVVFVVVAPPKVRIQALKVTALGCVAVWMLLGDPQIVSRFMTTFAETEERDNSAASRLDYWMAGLRMVSDYPLGTGGDGFHNIHGPKYISQINGADFSSRSVHNGFINEACDWGVQGIVLRMAFLLGALMLLRRTGVRAARRGDQFATMAACGLIAGMAGFLIQSIFGDFVDNEWGYWMAALAVAHASVCAVGRSNSVGPWGQFMMVPVPDPVIQSPAPATFATANQFSE
ncbi:MAG: O-antigen ligase family protein [Planctomycetaceae bacterium]